MSSPKPGSSPKIGRNPIHARLSTLFRSESLEKLFRSGSVEKLSPHLDVGETRARSYSYNESDRQKQTAGKGDMEAPKTASSSSNETITGSSEKRVGKRQPKGTFEYIVQEGDTVVKIGARFDVTPSELFKINKLLSWAVFVGQVLYIPDSVHYTGSNPPSPKCVSPVLDPRQRAASFNALPDEVRSDGSPAEPVRVIIEPDTTDKMHEKSTKEEIDKETQPRFLKMPSRRLIDEEEMAALKKDAAPESLTVIGTLLVTPNAIMFDPDVSDPAVINSQHQQKFRVVVYMEEIRSVALFRDISPRMFWKQPKELRAHSPRPETYRSDQTKCLETDGQCKKKSASSSNVDTLGRTEELLHQTEASKVSQNTDRVEHTGASSQEQTSTFPVNEQSGSHLSGPSPKVHHQTSSPSASPGDPAVATCGDSVSDGLSASMQAFTPVKFTDRSPTSVTTHPEPLPGQKVFIQTQSHDLSVDVKSVENEAASDFPVAENKNNDHLERNAADHLERNAADSSDDDSTTRSHSDSIVDETAEVSSDSQKLLSSIKSDKAAKSHSTKSKSSSSAKRGTHKHGSEDLKSVVGRLAMQLSNLTWDSGDDKVQTPKPRDGSPHSPLSLHLHQDHFSSSHASNLLHDINSRGKQGSLASPPADSKLPSTTPYRLQLKSEFTKADISRVLGPDPREFLRRSDSHYFEDSPLFLQIRHGIRKNAEVTQPRAFDHWNVGPMLNEYWFMVPHHMGDKLYKFLMAWQPDAYGNEEETESRGKSFHDVDDLKQSVKVSGGDGSQEDLCLLEDHFKEGMKTWEILNNNKQQGGGAEREQTLYRQITIDESNIPELIGTSLIMKEEHIHAILQVLPWNMTVGYNWKLVYGTHKHGYSLQNLYLKAEAEEDDDDSPMLLLIVDTYGIVFGAYLSNTIHTSENFYGTGATFLFTFHQKFKKFPWSGDNHFFIHGGKEFFAVGLGKGAFGLWLDGALDKGLTRTCTTFHNDILTEQEDFSVVQLEVWKFVETSQM